MSENLKRNMTYFSRYQMKCLLLFTVVGLLYGWFMAGVSPRDGTGNGMLLFWKMYMLFTGLFIQNGFFVTHAGMAVSMGATRRNLIRTHRMLTAISYVAIWGLMLLFLLCPQAENGQVPRWFLAGVYLALISLFMSLGILFSCTVSDEENKGRVIYHLMILLMCVLFGGMSAVMMTQGDVIDDFYGWMMGLKRMTAILWCGALIILIAGMAFAADRVAAKRIRELEVRI